MLINLPAGDLMQGGPGLAAVPERQEAFDAALQEALNYALMVRPACVNVLPGRLAEGVERELALETLGATCGRPPMPSSCSASACFARRSIRWTCRDF